MSGVVARRRDDINLSIRQAHMTAVLGRVEKIEPVDEYLIGGKPGHTSGQVDAGEGLAAWATFLSAQRKGG
jgi:hypothetical protein